MANQTINLTATLPELNRTSLKQEPLKEYGVPWSSMRVWDAIGTNLPATAASDDLGLVGTWASASPMLKSITSSGTTVNAYARFSYVLPPEYDDGQRVYVRLRAKVEVAAQLTATIDVVAYESTKEGGIGTDLCNTDPQSINSTSFANYDFVITPTDLVAGDVLDIRVHVALDDTGGSHATIANIGNVAMLLDIRG